MTQSDEEFQAILPELLAIYPGEPQFRYREGHQRVGHVAHGWYLRVHRGVEATLVLGAAGFAAESAPIRRSVIEHAVALRWLAKEGSVVEGVLKRGASHDARKRKESIEKAGWTAADVALFDAVIADGELLDSSRDNELHFKQRCDRAGDAEDWASYLVETAHCHPSWQSAAPYLEEDPPTGGVSLRRDGRDTVSLYSFGAIHVLYALEAINAITRGKPLNKRLGRLDREIRSTLVKAFQEQELPVPNILRRGRS